MARRATSDVRLRRVAVLLDHVDVPSGPRKKNQPKPSIFGSSNSSFAQTVRRSSRPSQLPVRRGLRLCRPPRRRRRPLPHFSREDLAFSCSGPKTLNEVATPRWQWKIDQPASVCTLWIRASRNNAEVASKFPVLVPRKQIRCTFIPLHTAAARSDRPRRHSRTLAQPAVIPPEP